MLYEFKVFFGLQDDIFNKMIDDGRLPESLRDFRQKYQAVYDIETLETSPKDIDASSPDAILNPVSIGCATNVPGVDDKWFCVRSSEPGEIQIMVDEFMNHLVDVAKAYESCVPVEIRTLLSEIRKKLAEKNLPYHSKRYTLEQELNCLKKYEILPVYAFNGARFDLVVLMPYIAKWCGTEINTNMIKRGAQYMMLNVDRIQFRDVLDFTAPTNLDKYLKTWQASAAKSIFPYSHFNSIEKLESTCEFPPKEAFFNQLKQVSTLNLTKITWF